MSLINQFLKALTALAKVGVGAAFLVLIASVLVQVVGRLYGSSPVWSEELTRYALLYMVAFGAGLAFRSGDLVNVDVISEMLPIRVAWMLRLLSAVATAGLTLMLLPQAWRYVSIGKMQSSPALGVRMDFIHLSVWLLLVGLALFSLARVVGMLIGIDDGKPVSEE